MLFDYTSRQIQNILYATFVFKHFLKNKVNIKYENNVKVKIKYLWKNRWSIIKKKEKKAPESADYNFFPQDNVSLIVSCFTIIPIVDAVWPSINEICLSKKNVSL